MLSGYLVSCYTPGCEHEAVYKIAARWSDGFTGELKTYGLCCADCLRTWYERSVQKQATCRLASGETLEPPGIYRLQHGQRDRQLERLSDLEKELARR